MKCPNCGLDGSESATKCSCGYDFHSGVVPPAAESRTEVVAKRRNPIWAGVLSLVMPGLGQIYNGQFTKGVVFYVSLNILILVVGLSGVLFNFWGLIIFVVAPIVLSVAIIVEAALTSRKLGSIALQRYNRWYVYVLSIIIAGVLNNFVWSKPILGRVKSYSMPATSMEPTIKRGDHMIASMAYYTRNKPKQSDIVVFRYPEDTYGFALS